MERLPRLGKILYIDIILIQFYLLVFLTDKKKENKMEKYQIRWEKNSGKYGESQSGFIGKNYLFEVFFDASQTKDQYCLICFFSAADKIHKIQYDTIEKGKQAAGFIWQQWIKNLSNDQPVQSQQESFPVYAPNDKENKALTDKKPPKKEKPEKQPDFIFNISHETCSIKHTPTNIFMFHGIDPKAIKMLILNLNGLNIKWNKKEESVPKDFLVSCINTLKFIYGFYGITMVSQLSRKKEGQPKKIKRRG